MADGLNRRLSAAIYLRLTTHADTVAVFGNRAFPIIAPQGTAYPLVVFRRANSQAPAALSGTVERPTVSLEVRTYARTYAAALDGAEAVRKALNGLRGTVANCTIQRCTYVSESDGAEVPQDAQMLPDYYVTQNYEVRVEDSTA